MPRAPRNLDPALAAVIKGIVRSASLDVVCGRYFSVYSDPRLLIFIVHVHSITYLLTSPLRLAAISLIVQHISL